MRKTPLASRKGVADDYLDLVKEFPLRPLRDARDFKSAGEILDRLIGRDDLTTGQRDYLAALLRFVEDHELARTSTARKQLSSIELLRHLMEENDMNTTDLGYIVGSRGVASEILNGTRQLSKRTIARLAERFNVDPGLFLTT